MDTSPQNIGKGTSERATAATGGSSPPSSQRPPHDTYSRLSGEDRKYGYDVELFLDRSGASPYLCCVCMNVVEDCHETSCGHIFCGPCIKRALSTDDQFRCPIDRTTNIEVHPSRFVNRAVCNLKVKCPNHTNGCDWQGALKDLVDVVASGDSSSSLLNGEMPLKKNMKPHSQTHLAMCVYARVTCENCGISVPRLHYEKHSSQCASTCPFCSKYLADHNEDGALIAKGPHAHIEMCPLAVVECPDGCKQTMKREDLNRHLREDCRERTVTCPYSSVGCPSRVKLKHVQNHLKYNSSSHTQMKLDHTCEQVDKNSKTVETLIKQIDVLTHKMELLVDKVNRLESTAASNTDNRATTGGAGSSDEPMSLTRAADLAPDVLILRGNNQWEVTGIFIRRSKFHAGRVCYTLTHGPCAIRWHPTLSAWLIDRRGLKYDQEASLIAYEDVMHPGLVNAPWYVFHADQHRWIESESYRVESCNLAELFFKCETICPEYCLPMTPNGGAGNGNGPNGVNMPNPHMRPVPPSNSGPLGNGSSSLFVLNGGNPNMNGHAGEPEMFVDDLENLNGKHDFRHHQPPGLVPGKENEDPTNRNRRSKKSWRKLEVDFQ